MLDKIRGGLVVSCQALDTEPLHSAFIMSRMALAARQGGAVGIRANSKDDILAIRDVVDLPIIGIVKRDYPGSAVFITPTRAEVDELIASGCDMVAMDATARSRPRGDLAALVAYAKGKGLVLMADVASLDDVDTAAKQGFDCVSTTLYGYTAETAGHKLYDDDFAFLKLALQRARVPVIAEGNVVTPEMYARCMAIGAFACVVGSAITRPQLITRRFYDAWQQQSTAAGDA